ncbi:LytR family transcriptional regulator, partial [Streptomyces sp. NPDC049970]
MDAHSRGRAEEVDAADQWVLDPRTGNYELRLNHSGTESSGHSRAAVTAPGRDGSAASRGEVPAQRGRVRPTAPGPGREPS